MLDRDFWRWRKAGERIVMMTTKLKIDLSEGILEVEGSESFVKAIYNDFKAHFVDNETDEVILKPKRSRRARTTKTSTSKST